MFNLNNHNKQIESDSKATDQSNVEELNRVYLLKA